jgi:ferredoxin
VKPAEDARKLASMLTASIDTNDFYVEAHPKLRPVESPTAGIFLSGMCQGPKDIPETVSQAGAAAAKVIGLLAKDKLMTNPCTAKCNERICSGCLTCTNVCPYGAISGVEKEVIYNLERIVNEKIEGLARDRHLAYAVCDALQDGKNEQETKVHALEKWYNWAQPQRDANVYGALSLRMKLNLMGYDYKKGEMDEKIAKEFMAKYQENDAINYKEGVVGGKKLITYTNDFIAGSLRERMAIQEHQRWNAYMTTQGVIPSSKKEIKEEGGKNLTLRRHGCLTTFEGLVEYRKIMATCNGTNEELEDVIRYDYQLLDDAVWLLRRNGYTIVKRVI